MFQTTARQLVTNGDILGIDKKMICAKLRDQEIWDLIDSTDLIVKHWGVKATYGMAISWKNILEIYNKLIQYLKNYNW